jgi:hypothetical protein
MGGRIFFEKKLQLAGVKFDLSSEGWATTRRGSTGPGARSVLRASAWLARSRPIA